MQLKIAVIATGLLLSAAMIPVHLAGRAEGRESGQTVRFPGARTSKDGEIWLGWDVGRRTGYVDGYINGNRDGHNAGCHAAFHIFLPKEGIISQPTNVISRCFAEEVHFTKGQAPDYISEITKFYEQYPSDRDAPLNYVLELISDRERKTAEQMHQYFLAPPREN